jgi:aminoglycoside phosphotransferase (APT) family kinase protein
MGEKYPGLEDLVKWLIENRPPEPEKNVIVHGDFHPMNLLVKDGKVSTILDWSGFMVGDPMYDLGWTKALLLATAKHETPPEVLDRFIEVYMESYESISPIDYEKLDYYVVYRLVRALFEGKEGQVYWTKKEIVDNITGVLKEMTGIKVHL